MAVTNGRSLALEALGDRQGMVMAHLERLLAERRPAAQETHLATELVRGVVRRQRTLDQVIRAFSEQPGRNMHADIRNILRLAIYEFLFEAETPKTVIINEALEIARKFSTFEATQFINGILDAIKRDLESHNSASSATVK